MFNFLLFIAVYLPFQLALNPSEGIDLASGRILIILLFLCWLAESLKKKKIIISKKLSSGFLLSFLFLNAFSLVVARNSAWSERKLMFLFSLVPIYFVGQALLTTAEKKRKLIEWLVRGAFVASLVGIFQFGAQFIFGRENIYNFWANYLAVPFLGKTFSQAVLQNPSWLVNISGETYLRATAFFPDPHMLAFFLGLNLPLAVGIFITSPKQKILNLFVIGVLFLADLLTFSRGGYLGLLAGFIFLVIIFWQKFSRKYKLAIIFLVVLMAISSLLSGPVKQRFASIFDFNEGSNKGRLQTWGQALGVIEEHPWLGVGIGNYPLAIKATADYREPIYAHNAYLDIAAETGILNLLFWIGFLGLTIRGLYRSQNKLSLFSSASLVIFAVHSLVETGLYSATVLPIFLIIASLNNE